jgi:Flp pilus assembly protein TadG
MKRRVTHRKGEQGAIIIQVAISLFMLMCFLAFVCDYGVVWASRAQAQNAADAGALAGAIARGYDDYSNPPAAGGPVQTAATLFAQRNTVWGQAGGVVVSYNCPAGVSGGGCVRVDVYRNGTNGSNTLPTYFGPLLNVTSQGVRATATAQALPANATNCLKPWAVADKWLEGDDPPPPGSWTQQSVFNPPIDTYIPPYGTGGTGFSNRDANGNLVNYGMQLMLKFAHPGNASMSSGWAMDLTLPAPSGGGGSALRADIQGCTTATVAIATQGQQCTAVDYASGCVGVLTGGMTGPSIQGVSTLIANDSGAYWSDGAGANGGVISQYSPSPRIVPVAVFDPQLYLSQGYNGSNGIIKVVNILGFFIEGFCKDNSFLHESYLPPCTQGGSNDLVGRLVPFNGTMVPNGVVAGPSAFGQVIRLIR